MDRENERENEGRQEEKERERERGKNERQGKTDRTWGGGKVSQLECSQYMRGREHRVQYVRVRKK